MVFLGKKWQLMLTFGVWGETMRGGISMKQMIANVNIRGMG